MLMKIQGVVAWWLDNTTGKISTRKLQKATAKDDDRHWILSSKQPYIIYKGVYLDAIYCNKI